MSRSFYPHFISRGSAAAIQADVLYEHAGGNPRVLLETLRDIPPDWMPGKPLPLSGVARAVLERRIRALPERALQLLQLTAVLDDYYDLAAQALNWPRLEFEACRAELESRYVLRADGGFVNDTMHDVALASLTAQELVHWHGLAAATLKRDPGVPMTRIAMHWEVAQQYLPAGLAYRAAAQQANHSGSAGEARRLYAHAATCLRRQVATTEEFEALYEAIESELLLKDVGPARAIGARMKELASTPRQHACVALVQALLAVHEYPRGSASLPLTADAVRATEPFPDLHCDALAMHAAALSQDNQFDSALEASEKALVLAQGLKRPRQLREITSTRLYVLHEVDRVTEAAALCRELIDAYEGAHDAAGATSMEGHLAVMQLTFDPEEAWKSATRACARHRAIDLSALGPMAVMHRAALASACIYKGRFSDALAALNEDGRLISEGVEHIGIRAKVMVTLAHAWLLLGVEDAALDALGANDARWPPSLQVQRYWALARVAQLRGRDGYGHLKSLDEIHRNHRGSALAHTSWLEWSRQGDPHEVAEAMLAIRGRYERAGMSASARSAILRCIDRLGELDDAGSVAAAVELARPLLQQLDAGAGLHATTYLPEAWLVLSRALERADDRAAAAAARGAGMPLDPSSAGRHRVAGQLRAAQPGKSRTSGSPGLIAEPPCRGRLNVTRKPRRQIWRTAFAAAQTHRPPRQLESALRSWARQPGNIKTRKNSLWILWTRLGLPIWRWM